MKRGRDDLERHAPCIHPPRFAFIGAAIAGVATVGCGGPSASSDSPSDAPSAGDQSVSEVPGAEASSDAQPSPDAATESASLNLDALTPSCFQGGTEPELQLDDGFTGSTWNDPSVIQVGAEYWMYASSNVAIGSATPVQIYRLTSSDAAHWTLNPTAPVFVVGGADAWDRGGVETPSVVYFSGAYHLFYTGYPDTHGTESAFDYRLGHATSVDGIIWIRDATYLLGPTDPTATFYQYIVGEPGPVVFQGALVLYFTAVGNDATVDDTLQVIGVTTSTDGLIWSTPTLALRPDPTLYPRTGNWVGYSTPNAVVLGGQMHLFVDVANDGGDNMWTQEALQHAWSADGVTDWTQDSAPLRTTKDFAWTAREIRSPAALLDGTTLRLYFAGDDYFASHLWGIGQMTCALSP